jgi:tetratricopeptide (TPR) repeat protein
MSEDFNSQRKKAESLYADKQWAKAEQIFAALMSDLERKGEPANGDIIHDHAVCVFQLGRTKEALQAFDRAVDLEPNHAYRYASRAWIKAAMKDVDGAIADYKKALELDPEDAITLNNLGLLEEQYGMRKSAQEKFRRADTLMGILKDAGVDPPEAVEQNTESSTEEVPPPPSTMWREMTAVLTNASQRKAFWAFVKKGFRS